MEIDDEKNKIIELCKNSKTGLRYKETFFKKEFPLIYNEFEKIRFPKEFTLTQKLYHFLNNDYELKLGICYCGKRCGFIGLLKGYYKHCCTRCSSRSLNVKKKYKETCIKKYGTENPSQSNAIKRKVKETNLNRYGVENVFLTKESKEKREKTFLLKYGSSCVIQSEKVKDTIKKKYGVEHISQSEEIKEKIKQSNLEKYGAENVFQLDSVKEKAKKTNLEKYGVENASQSEEIKEKIKQSNLEKYGIVSACSSCVVKNKIKETNNLKYGVDYVFQLDSVKEKAKKTNLEKYGVENASQSEEIKEKIKQSNLKKYGVENASQSEEIKEKIRQSNLEKYGMEWFCNHPNAKKHSSNNSKPNLLFEEKLKKFGIAYEREFPLTNYSYDFKTGGTLIEINPTITHNSHLNIFGGDPKEPNYHLNKSNTAKENGFHCIHVWEWDNEDKIVNLLKPKETLYARNLEIKDVDTPTTDKFLNQYHLQNTCKGQTIRLGLFLNGELIQLMTFGKPRYNKNCEWELLRLCSHSDYMVVGGSKKLFGHFIKSHNPKSIVSYCDLSKFDGGVYVKLGFVKKGTSNPSKHWCCKGKHITDNLLRQRGFDQLFGANYGKGTSNEKLMLEHGFLPVYDCGQATYMWYSK